MAGFFVQNFGCRATQADGAALERQFQERGLSRATSPNDAEVVVLNTCTVTASADQDARAAIRRIHRENPGCQIVVTGCYAQRAPEEVAALPGVSQVIGNSHKHQLVEIALPMLPFADRQILVSDIFAHTELVAAPVFDAANERTRPNLKVQDGCDNRCSFCVIPYVRGQSRSLKLDKVIREVNTLVSAGYREVVISGINLGRWGRDLASGPEAPAGTGEEVAEQLEIGISGAEARTHFKGLNAGPEALLHLKPEFLRSLSKSGPPQNHPGRRFSATSDVPFPDRGQRNGFEFGQRPKTNDQRQSFEFLIRAILHETSLEKLRISSVEPMDWSDELIELMANSPRIAKHAHVPMQSGSDAVLRRMHRKYRPWHYGEKLEKIRAAMPTAAIGADVMVGFPGETEPEFEETRRMIESLPLTYLHVFTYSPRPGTTAAEMRNQVPVQIARERNRILRELAAEKKLAFMRCFVGKPLAAITLDKVQQGLHGEFTEALTDNYLKLQLKGCHAPNCWIQVQVEQVEDGFLIGVPTQGTLGSRQGI